MIEVNVKMPIASIFRSRIFFDADVDLSPEYP
jgi:hypothetical protein